MSRLFSLVISLGLIGACTFDRGGLPAEEAPPPDAIEVPPPEADAALPPDAAPPVIVPDAEPPKRGEVGDVCQEDEDCATEACESFGNGTRRCAQLCGLLAPACPDDLECDDGVCVPE